MDGTLALAFLGSFLAGALIGGGLTIWAGIKFANERDSQ